MNACLAPIGSVAGIKHHFVATDVLKVLEMAVTTVEGIGSARTRLHPVQVQAIVYECNVKERIAKSHGSQCGFCTPGIVMSMYTLLRNNPEPTAEEVARLGT